MLYEQLQEFDQDKKTPGKTQYNNTLLISSLKDNKAQRNLAKNLVETFSQIVS